MLKTVNLSEVIIGKKPITVKAGVTVREACQVMSRAEKGAIMVLSEGRLQGIFTERDLLKRVVAEGLNPDVVSVDDVMTRSLVVGSPDDSYQRALQKMVSATCRHLPVVKGDKVVGLVSRRDLMGLDIELLEEELDLRDPATLFI
jgi:CBS domain-containing protein